MVPYYTPSGLVFPQITAEDKGKTAPMSNMEMHQTNELPSQADVLFLKRLLFLKATLDNQ